MYRGIYGKPFVQMDEFLDIEGLKAIHDDIVDGICFSYRTYGVYGVNVVDQDRFLDLAVAEKRMAELPETNPLKVRYNQFAKRGDQRFFLKMVLGAYSGFHSVTLRSSASFADKHSAAKCNWLQNAQYFPTLRDWIYRQTIFSEVGRINIFCTEHDCLTVEHRDNNKSDPHRNEMIWFRTKLDKSLYIKDPDTNEKHYLEGHACFFNDMDIHGGDRPEQMVFSIRVDGQFTVETRRAIGVPDEPSY